MTGWAETTLGELCQIKPPKKEAKQKLSDTDMVSFVPMHNLGICVKSFEPNGNKVLGLVSGSYTYFAENDIIIAKICSFNKIKSFQCLYLKISRICTN